MTLSSVHGAMFSRTELENNVLTHLKNWFVYYLARIEEAIPLEPRTLATPKSWRVTQEFARNPEDALPFLDVVSSGTNPGRRPRVDGDRTVTAWWSVAVGAIVSTGDSQASKDLAGYYGTAIRLVMGQMPDLGNWANSCDWEAESYDDFISREFERTVATVRMVFTVEVPGVMELFEGPPDSTQPPEDPYAPLPAPGLAHPVTVELSEAPDG